MCKAVGKKAQNNGRKGEVGRFLRNAVKARSDGEILGRQTNADMKFQVV